MPGNPLLPPARRDRGALAAGLAGLAFPLIARLVIRSR